MNLVDRAKNIILTPKTEWPVIAGEEPNATAILTGYVIPLALIPAVASILGYGLIGSGFMHSFTWGISYGVTSFVSTVLGVYLTAFVVDFLAPNFGSQKNFGRAMQLVAYSYTPAWVAGVLNIVPALGIIGALAGLYGLYLMYLGLPHTMKTPQDKVVVYLVVTVIALLVIFMVIGMIIGGIMAAVLGLSLLGGAGVL
jgi:hypothetical protein